MRSLPHVTLQPASRAVAQRRRIQVSPSESNLCEADVRLKPCLLGWRQLVATTSPTGRSNLNDGPRHPIRHSSFVIRFAQMPVLNTNNNNNKINMLFFKNAQSKWVQPSPTYARPIARPTFGQPATCNPHPSAASAPSAALWPNPCFIQMPSPLR